MGGKERTQTSPSKPARGARGKAPGKPAKASKPKGPTKAGKAPAKAGKAPAKASKAPAKAGKAPKSKKKAQPGAQRDLPRLLALLAETWSEARVELDHESAYELLVATILAAQSTDKRINQVTPALFARYPNARSLAGADQAELEEQIRSTGFFRMKAKHLLGMARAVVERHDGEIPRTMDELCALPGVARKTANVVLGNFFGIAAGIVVDTHVTRLARRLGLTSEDDPEKIERDLMAVIPREQWISFADRLIWHGRRICFARKPACDLCPVAPLCPSAGIGARAIPESPGAGLPEEPEALP
ncbi:MAG TPA: endonuclease III [Haliangium sp.]|nr:endonuclease III [Haliangium sp.]